MERQQLRHDEILANQRVKESVKLDDMNIFEYGSKNSSKHKADD